MKLQSSISLVSCLLAVWLAVHAVPPVHAQDSRPPPSAAGHLRLQPRAAVDERAQSAPRSRSQNKRRRSPGLLSFGVAIFAPSYLVSTAFGAIQLVFQATDHSVLKSCDDGCQTSKLLFIPLAGPWLALSKEHRGAGFVVLGAWEALGFMLTLAGGYVYSVSGRTSLASMLPERFMIAALPMRDGAQLALRLSL